MKNRPMTSDRAFVVDCRIESHVDERGLARRDVSDEMQFSEIELVEHASLECPSSNVGRLPWKASNLKNDPV